MEGDCAGNGGCPSPPAAKRKKLLDAMDKEESLQLRKEYIAPSLSLHYSKVKPLKIIRGCGQYLYDEKDKPYLDCINNVTHVGHCHPKVVQAGADQMRKLSCLPWPTYGHKLLEKYSEHILSTFPDKLDFAFFTSSGSEANDLALWIAETVTGHSEVIVIEGAYHGHTKILMGLSTYKTKHLRKEATCAVNTHAWIASLPDSYRGKYCDPAKAGRQYAADVKDIIDKAESQGKKVAAFLCEAFVGCAGQVMLPAGYLEAVFEHVHAAGGLAIIDEVQTGFGRAGDYFWMFEAQGVCPDMVTIGKPMGNGHPISAVVTTHEIADRFIEAQRQESLEAYCSDPVSLAIAEAVLTAIEEEELQSRAKEVGGYVMKGLRGLMEKHLCIGDVRGYGLFIGFELVRSRDTKEPATQLAVDLVHRVMLNHRVLIMNDGLQRNVIKVKPPLCFTQDNADTLLHAIDETLCQLTQ